jgi:hypothetical protein
LREDDLVAVLTAVQAICSSCTRARAKPAHSVVTNKACLLLVSAASSQLNWAAVSRVTPKSSLPSSRASPSCVSWSVVVPRATLPPTSSWRESDCTWMAAWLQVAKRARARGRDRMTARGAAARDRMVIGLVLGGHAAAELEGADRMKGVVCRDALQHDSPSDCPASLPYWTSA